MAQSILLPTPAMPHMMPNSPDPTPLRMLAFSVAEAALSSDPNSPFFFAEPKVPTAPRFVPTRNDDWDEAFQADWKQWNGGVRSIAERRGKVVWDVLEKAKERKEKSSHFIETATLTVSPPISPSSYNFVLPRDSQLAASIARHQGQQEPTVKPTQAFTKRQQFPLYTCSAEPSPTRSTFSGLDQTRPPPEFVPRLTAREFSQQAKKTAADLATSRERRRSSIEPVKAAALSSGADVPNPRAARRSSRLPSLQQIQAKVSGTSRVRRSGSFDALPAVRPVSPRTESCDSIESLEIRTPDDEIPNPLLHDRRRALQIIMKGRPATPPSPGTKEPRLSSFLRERTNGRLAGVSSKVNIMGGEILATPEKIIRPVLKVTPPSYESRPAVPPLHLGRATQASPTKAVFPFRSGFSTPTESRFSYPLAQLSTPPSRNGTPAPTSPTGSIRSNRSSASSSGQNGSPSLSMPIITCTPAPSIVLRDGLEQDSDDGSETSGDVMLFDGEAEEREREEREKRGAEMRAKLLRRRSSE